MGEKLELLSKALLASNLSESTFFCASDTFCLSSAVRYDRMASPVSALCDADMSCS